MKRNSTQISVIIMNYRSNLDHDFDWDNVEVLDEKINYIKII